MNDTATATAPVPEETTTATTAAPSPAPADIENDPAILRVQVGRLEDEMRAHKDFRARCDGINRRITLAGKHLEMCAKEHKAAKEDHEDALEELRAFTSGDVQTTIDVTDQSAAKEPKPAPSTPVSQQPDLVAVAGTFGAWQFMLTAKDIEGATALAHACHEGEFAKRRVKPINILGDKPHGVIVFHKFADGSGFVDLLPLVETDEWAALHAEAFGSAVRDLGDESPDLAERRRRGGECCGFMVKAGKRKLVVAPDSLRVRVVFTQIEGDPSPADFEARKLLPAGFAGGVLETPRNLLGDAMAKRLAEYEVTSEGHHEGLSISLADDLKVSPEEIIAAAKDDAFRFDVLLTSVNGESGEAVRLLVKADDVAAPFAGEG